MKIQQIFTDKELKLISTALWLASIHGTESNQEMLNLKNKIDVSGKLQSELESSNKQHIN